MSEIVSSLKAVQTEFSRNPWADCRYLTCSVLPVRMACNLSCKFCFSKSSISTLEQAGTKWTESQLERYFAFSRSLGASRLVITGGGEPLLRTDAVRTAVRVGGRFFNEIALFTNGVLLNRQLVRELVDSGLSYICFSRHHYAEEPNRALMGDAAITLEEFFNRVDGQVKVRAICVLCRGYIHSSEDVWKYVDALEPYGVREFTFKHTYVAYEHSVFGKSAENLWALDNQVQQDPFSGEGQVIAKLPWGPQIKKIGELQICYYYEPTPEWELKNLAGRSLNLLADGKVYGSLEDQRSLLFTLSK
jgi:pyruvate-formate lyase-activating enzyme